MSWNKGLNLRMTCNKLRIDPNDGSPVLEYRVEDGRVERRIVETAAPVEVQWQQLTSEQLSSQVLANTVLAHWLAQRFGVRALVRACDQQPLSVDHRIEDRPRYRRDIVVGEFTPLEHSQPGRTDSSTAF